MLAIKNSSKSPNLPIYKYGIMAHGTHHLDGNAF
jgi:hypothetical protein